MIIGSAGRTKAEKAVGVAVCGTANLLSGQLERPLFQKPPDIRFASALQHANVALQQINELIAAANAVGQEQCGSFTNTLRPQFGRQFLSGFV